MKKQKQTIHISTRFLEIMFGIVLGMSFQFILNAQSWLNYVQFFALIIIFIDYWLELNESIKRTPLTEFKLMLNVVLVMLMFFNLITAIYTVNIFLLLFACFFGVDVISTYMNYIKFQKKKSIWREWSNIWIYNDTAMGITCIAMILLNGFGIINEVVASLSVLGLYTALRIYVGHKTKIAFSYSV